ncbi:stage V sporulation protein AB [Anaerosporobacter faecicola]|uniref:stage V sporulation protein AB n=1 Tax=Anaerosporobacter faecicola TaxID=2718714 RepID=UPI00143C25BA|nr:stage V sporulation protein AB [Anaerosporobacter faecicola]
MQKEKERQLNLLENSILALIGFAGGLIVAGGVFAFITLLGVVNRLASKTGTAKHIVLYENMVIIGGILGNSWFVYQWRLPFGVIGLLCYGLFSGIFIGCQAMALAEVLNVIPVFSKRVRIHYGMPYIVASIACGKAIGAYLQLYIWGQ